MLNALKLILAVMFAAGLMIYPESSINAVLGSIEYWAKSVLPSLFPFIAIIPFLTCDYAREAYGKLFGAIVHKLFKLPASCASAIVVGLFSGSPSGAIAVKNTAVAEKLSPSQAAKMAGVACGVSPVYVISGIGFSLYGSESMGWTLAIAQFAALILTGIIFRSVNIGNSCSVYSAPVAHSDTNPIALAVSAVLKVGGYMALFASGLSMLENFIGEYAQMLSPVIDLPTGARYLSTAVSDKPFIAAAAIGFGGMCITAQNMNVLKETGVGWGIHIIQKAVTAVVCALVFAVSSDSDVIIARIAGNELEFCTLTACIFAIPMCLYVFLNNTRTPDSCEESA